MGLFTDHMYADWYGNAIEVEAKVAGLDSRIEYSLFINGQRVDTAYAMMGKFTLRGEVSVNSEKYPAIVWVKQGLFGTTYHLEINGQTFKMQKAQKRRH